MLLKLICLVFLCILLPVNWITYGPGNILWFSDITLILAILGLVLESRLLVSMAAVQGLLFESIWIVVFIVSLVFPHHWELTSYMFDSSIPLWIRCLSLFHLVLPPFLVWLVYRFGYTRKAWPIQTVFAWIVILLTWTFTKAEDNINFVFSYEKIGVNPILYLAFAFVAVSGMIAINHLILGYIGKKPAKK